MFQFFNRLIRSLIELTILKKNQKFLVLGPFVVQCLNFLDLL